MKKIQLRKVILYGCLMVFLAISLMACGKYTNEDKGDSQTEEDSQEQNVVESALFLIAAHDTMEETLTLYSYDTGLEHYYEYSFSTQFKDKHGNYAPATEFSVGRAVTIGGKDSEGYLKDVQLTDEVWEYENVHRFSVDELKGVFTIADTRYSIRDKVYVFSDGERISLADLSKEEDVLTVVGKGKQILSIVVTTGHGSLVLRNTSLFDGSFLQLNNDIFAIISDSMEMDLPEGHYTLKVANNGWGGTTELEVVRGETTEIDLDTLKGEGRKTGIVRFEIDVENVEVLIDHEKVDHLQPVEVTYGTHLLEIKAEGYEKWKKYLAVNSEDATISIELTESEEVDEEQDTEDTEENSEEESTEEDNTQESERETETSTQEASQDV